MAVGAIVSRLKRFYVIGLSAIALLAIGSQILVQHQIRSFQADGRQINLAGRQRMLSQELTKCVLILQRNNDAAIQAEYRDKLSKILVEWERVQRGLRYGDEALGLPADLSPPELELLEKMEPHFRAILDAAKNLAIPQPDRDPIAEQELINHILQEEKQYLPIMDSLVFLLDEINAEQVGNLERVEWVLLIILITVLGLEALLIFEPALKTIRQSIQHLTEARQEALDAARVKSQFLANMSHEIRTPMSGVLGLSELLNQTDLKPEQREYAEGIHASASALLNVINDILDFSRISENKLVLRQKRFNLLKTISEVADLLGVVARKKNLELIVDYPANEVEWFMGDASRLRQVLMNLIGNALKFTATGHVLVKTELLSAKDDNFTIRIHVKDTGIGIKAQELAEIFKPFHQVDGQSNRQFGGTGLGLAISRQIVDRMGGRLEAESTPNQGSDFWFEFNAAKAAPVEPEENLAKIRSGLKILVVDDLEINRNILRRQLESEGIYVVESDSVASALTVMEGEAAQNSPFDLAIVDYQMPIRSGKDLVQAAKLRPAIKDVPLILLSSSAEDEQEGYFEAMGFAAVMFKPWRPDRLLTTIARLTSNETKERSDQTPKLDESNDDHVIVGTSCRILVAEDNAVNQMVIRHMLEGMGCSVDLADNGHAVLDKLIENTYNLVLMDCQMPELDGFETTRRIRNQETDNHIPIVALTAHVLPEDVRRCTEAGMDGYLSKPINSEALISVIRQYSKEKS